MATKSAKLEQISEAIRELDIESQRELLKRLPKLMNIDSEILGWQKVAESSLSFWDNAEDAVYDEL